MYYTEFCGNCNVTLSILTEEQYRAWLKNAENPSDDADFPCPDCGEFDSCVAVTSQEIV